MTKLRIGRQKGGAHRGVHRVWDVGQFSANRVKYSLPGRRSLQYAIRSIPSFIPV